MAELPRRRALLLGAALLGAACSAKTTRADPVSPVPPLDERISALERRHSARVGLFAADLGSGRTAEYHADDSPVTELAAGHAMSLGELCAAALQRSDNCAANLLLTTIGGPAQITAFARSIGDDRTRLDRWEIELNTALPGDPRDTSTPRALAGGYRAVLTGAVLALGSRQQLEDWMRGNSTSSMRAGLPAGWTSADKTGSGDYGSTNDIGIAYGPDGRKLLLGFMTRSTTDDPQAPALRPLIGELTTQVVSSLTS